jgi:hypothetical protein
VDALTAIIPAPEISGMQLCSQSYLTGGDCEMIGTRSHGLSPYRWKWEVTYSNGSHSPINTGWITSNGYEFPVPAGHYEIQVKVTVREDSGVAPRWRKSVQHTYYYVVCPDDEEMLRDLGPTLTPPNRRRTVGATPRDFGRQVALLDEEMMAECPT